MPESMFYEKIKKEMHQGPITLIYEITLETLSYIISQTNSFNVNRNIFIIHISSYNGAYIYTYTLQI